MPPLLTLAFTSLQKATLQNTPAKPKLNATPAPLTLESESQIENVFQINIKKIAYVKMN